MKTPSLRSAFAGVSLFAFVLALGASPAYADLVTLDTSSAIDSGSGTTITAGTNPTLNTSDGMATLPTFTSGGTNNYQVTIYGTYVANDGYNAISVTGDNSHGAMDVTTDVTFSGDASVAGAGSAVSYVSTGSYNFFTLASGASLTAGTSGTAAALVVSTQNSIDVTLHGTITGQNNLSAFSALASNTGGINLTSNGVLTAAGTASTIDLDAAGGAYAVSMSLTGGSVSATGSGSAIKLTNDVSSNNSIAISGAAVSSASTSAPAIDVSGVTTGYTSITVSGSGTVSGGGSADGIAIKLGNASDVVTITAAGQSITGQILTATDGNGTVKINSTSGYTSGGDLGSNTARLGSIQVLGGSASFGHDLYASAISLAGSETLTSNITSGTSATTLTLASTTLDLGTYNWTLGSGSTLTGSGTNTLRVALGSSANGKIVSSGTLTNSLGSATVAVTPYFSGNALVGEYVVLQGTSDTTGLSVSGVSSGILTRWTLTGVTSGTDAYGNAISTPSVVLVYSTERASTLGNLTHDQEQVIDAALDGGPAAVANSISALTTKEQVAGAATSLMGNISNSAATTTVSVVNSAVATVSNRLQSLIGPRGFSAGEEGPMGMGAWAEGFGNAATQGAREGANGFYAQGGGATFGLDKEIVKNVRVGAAFSFANSTVDEKGAATGNRTDIKSYQGTLYGAYNAQPWYVDGEFSFGFHNFDTLRRVAFTGFSDVATADHMGQHVGFNTEAGYPIPLAGLTLTPTFGLAYTHLHQDSYTERSANGAALAVGEVTTDSFKSTLGGRVAKDFTGSGYRLTPEAKAAWVHEYITDATNATFSYATGGTTFTNSFAKPASDGALLGAGLTLKTDSDISVSAAYTSELHDKYVGHAGTLQVRYEF
jgi:outer membrane autotransporter protein